MQIMSGETMIKMSLCASSFATVIVGRGVGALGAAVVLVGLEVGAAVGFAVGLAVWLGVGATVGFAVGFAVGLVVAVGAAVGVAVVEEASHSNTTAVGRLPWLSTREINSKHASFSTALQSTVWLYDGK